MLRRIGHRFEAFFRATTPDPFVLAVALTLLVFALAMTIEGVGPLEIVRTWRSDSGFWSLLAFSMQMVLILVTGHALAASAPVQALVSRLAALPRTGAAAAALVAAVSIACALVNWGLGLIVGALLAREVGRSCARRGVAAHYPLLVASGYSGLMCWHGGLSGTAPLKMTTEADVASFLGPELAAVVDPVPFTETVLGLQNLVVTGGLFVLVPLVSYLLAPKRGEPATPIDAYLEPEAPAPAMEPPSSRRRLAQRAGAAAMALSLVVLVLRLSSAGVARALDAIGASDGVLVGTLAVLTTAGATLIALARPKAAGAKTIPERIEESPWLMALIGVPFVAAVFQWLTEVGIAALEPNTMNLAFLAAGLLLHGSLARYARALGDAAAGAAGIVLQFPFYAGIMGVMRASGLARDMAEWLARAAPPELYTTVTFLSAGVVNLFVPSGGGQWAVQGPIAVRAAGELGVPIEQAIMAVADGDQWTNMLQPFWALPLLAITRIKARDILGYTALFLVVGGFWMAGCLLAFSL